MKRLTILTLAALLAATPAFAHPGHGGGFAAGFAHPMTGLDHVLAMVAVGLWAALRGGGATLAWPAAFVAAMTGGFAAAQVGFVAPQIEMMIAASVILLGGAVAFGLRAPVTAGAGAIALFGLLHGAAHGMALHGSPLPFVVGFVVASLLLHAAGVGLATGAARVASRWPLRLAGAGIAAAGASIMAGLI